MRTQETPLILLVGHCTPDAWMLRTAVGRADEDAEIDVVNDESQLRGHVQEPDRPVVALINRKLDGRFDAEDGLSLMATFGAGSSVPVLVSDLPEAHERAREAGGHPGFGKRAIHDDATTESIRSAIAAAVARHRSSSGT